MWVFWVNHFEDAVLVALETFGLMQRVRDMSCLWVLPLVVSGNATSHVLVRYVRSYISMEIDINHDLLRNGYEASNWRLNENDEEDTDSLEWSGSAI